MPNVSVYFTHLDGGALQKLVSVDGLPQGQKSAGVVAAMILGSWAMLVQLLHTNGADVHAVAGLKSELASRYGRGGVESAQCSDLNEPISRFLSLSLSLFSRSLRIPSPCIFNII
ncbi:uncharacterized protein SPSK_02843 [Sporothrix schenckii 1099-18]|uniref:Uncharacterized protein n=1 Tax=Sporothrix schenckii 1099-18 TaxID=1397361 RepID=A0A0F2MCG9_SPOSC|nr:uncharacterized protein SPSK_02843 [Sporothrix schenckii 1099-18]KJR86774.1 hypothetical protein SPSK_02843 [Sporothrix schenckii 1099-18]